jgi:hypothetical protein
MAATPQEGPPPAAQPLHAYLGNLPGTRTQRRPCHTPPSLPLPLPDSPSLSRSLSLSLPLSDEPGCACCLRRRCVGRVHQRAGNWRPGPKQACERCCGTVASATPWHRYLCPASKRPLRFTRARSVLPVSPHPRRCTLPLRAFAPLRLDCLPAPPPPAAGIWLQTGQPCARGRLKTCMECWNLWPPATQLQTCPSGPLKNPKPAAAMATCASCASPSSCALPNKPRPVRRDSKQSSGRVQQRPELGQGHWLVLSPHATAAQVLPVNRVPSEAKCIISGCLLTAWLASSSVCVCVRVCACVPSTVCVPRVRASRGSSVQPQRWRAPRYSPWPTCERSPHDC